MLGKWAVIDIETTGINPGEDEIIDIGFLVFEETKLVKQYSSLVKAPLEVSPFITKLTGITNKMLRNAPLWEAVEPELLELEDHQLIAHNSSFEEMFLKPFFEKYQDPCQVSFHDSIPFLGLLFPQFNKLNLESFIKLFNIAEKEEHRGLADSLDLLKVMIEASLLSFENKKNRLKVLEIFEGLPDQYWFTKFIQLSEAEVREVAMQIGYEPKGVARGVEEVQDESLPLELDFSFSSENLKNIFQNEEQIQKVLPSYRFRNSQLEMALKVGQSLKNEIHALVQAPTGTGKTLGYLLPAVLYHLENREPVLVATGTKTLQTQVVSKDIVQLKKMLGSRQVKFTKLVGSQNHLCELLFREENNAELDLLDQEDQLFARAYLEAFFSYNDDHTYEEKLTKEDIPFILKKLFPHLNEMASDYSVDYRACVGQQCPYVNQCSYIQGLREAKEAGVIIGNHSLALNWPRSFPRPQAVIIDEAHKLEGEATSAYAIEVTEHSLGHLLKQLNQGVGALFFLLGQQSESYNDEIHHIRSTANDVVERAKDHLLPMGQVIESIFKKLPRYTPIHTNEIIFPQKSESNDALRTNFIDHLSSLEFIFNQLYIELFKWQEVLTSKKLQDDLSTMKAKAVFESFWGNFEKHYLGIKTLLTPLDDWCHVVKYQEDFGYTLCSYPIDVGQRVHQELLEKSASVIMTSATLANATGDAGHIGIEWMSGHLMLDPKKRFKTGFYLPAVFDYKNRAKVYLSTNLPPMNDPSFVATFIEQSAPLVEELQGRTLYLFSSRARFEKAVDLLLKKYEGRIPLFIQGMGKDIVSDFKQTGHGVLVGMESFGEGIDIPGESLQLIFIDKVPDIRQDLVIQKRRDFFEAKFGQEFQEYFLASRTRSLHQKCGRLLRSETDRGVVIIADQRLSRWKGGTIKTFKNLMRPYEIDFASFEDAVSCGADFLLKDSIH